MTTYESGTSLGRGTIGEDRGVKRMRFSNGLNCSKRGGCGGGWAIVDKELLTKSWGAAIKRTGLKGEADGGEFTKESEAT